MDGWVGMAGLTAGLVDGAGGGAVAGFGGEVGDLAAGVGEGVGVGVTALGLGAVVGAAVGLAGGVDWADCAEAGLASGLVSDSPVKCSLSLPLMASRMKSIQMGRATRAPCSLSPRDWRLS